MLGADRPPVARRAFTLVEILIVVVILGILAAIVTPQFASAADDSRRGAFCEAIRRMTQAVEVYYVRTGEFPADGASGVVPPGMSAYFRAADYQAPTPIGGVWDTERDERGIISAVGVHFFRYDPFRDDAYMSLIDAVIDDGDVTTGVFRRIAARRYYAVLAE